MSDHRPPDRDRAPAPTVPPELRTATDDGDLLPLLTAIIAAAERQARRVLQSADRDKAA